MAHKTLIGGTAYEIGGGKTLNDGTEYSIKSGKTLVDGTVYGIEFSSACTITITGYGSQAYSYVAINGITYTSPATVEVPNGTIMTCVCGDSYRYGNAHISVNGEVVAGVSGSSGKKTYEYTIKGNIAVSLRVIDYEEKDREETYGYVTITEE